MYIDSVNCPCIVKTFNTNNEMTSYKDLTPEYGGFEYELISSKKAIENGKLECEDWTHNNSIQFAQIIDDISNSKK